MFNEKQVRSSIDRILNAPSFDVSSTVKTIRKLLEKELQTSFTSQQKQLVKKILTEKMRSQEATPPIQQTPTHRPRRNSFHSSCGRPQRVCASFASPGTTGLRMRTLYPWCVCSRTFGRWMFRAAQRWEKPAYVPYVGAPTCGRSR